MKPAPLFDPPALDFTTPHVYEPPTDTRTADQLRKMAAITNFTTGEPTGKLKRLPIPKI